jgi:hypothetical protein
VWCDHPAGVETTVSAIRRLVEMGLKVKK